MGGRLGGGGGGPGLPCFSFSKRFSVMFFFNPYAFINMIFIYMYINIYIFNFTGQVLGADKT